MLAELIQPIHNIPFDPHSRLYWVYVLSSFGSALLAYFIYYNNSGFGISRFLNFIFPKSTYLHKSARVDYVIFIINFSLAPSRFLLSGLTIGVITIAEYKLLVTYLGEWQPSLQWNSFLNCIFTIVIAMVKDFSIFLVHAASHKYSFFWTLHRLHHSAKVLTPFTLFRAHPLYSLLSKAIQNVIIGVFYGFVFFAFQKHPEVIFILQINLVVAIFNFMGSNLRHSHVWLSYGKILSHIFISPAQHQIHHSSAKEHRNKNFGQMFALWDWMFGTLYVPKEKEELEFGLGSDDNDRHNTVWGAYIEPITSTFQVLKKKLIKGS